MRKSNNNLSERRGEKGKRENARERAPHAGARERAREKEEAGAPLYHSVVPTSEARQGGPSHGPHRNGSLVHATMALSVALVHVARQSNTVVPEGLARPKGLDMKIVFRLRSKNCFQEWLVIKY